MYACEVRSVSRKMGIDYAFMIMILLSCVYSLKKKRRRKEMGIQYEAHKVYFYYAFVKYDVIGYIMSPYCDE